MILTDKFCSGLRFSIFFLVFLSGIFSIPGKVLSISLETSFHYTHDTNDVGESTTYISTPLRISGQPITNLFLQITIPYVYQKNAYFITMGAHQLPIDNGQNVPIINTGAGAMGMGSGYGGPTDENGSNPDAGNGNQDNGSGSGSGNNPDAGNGNQDNGQQNGANNDSASPDRFLDDNDQIYENVENDEASLQNSNEIEQGIGDVSLVLSYNFSSLFTRYPFYLPSIDLSGGLKLPTADSEKNLGTGEYDYTLGLNLGWNFGLIGVYLYGDYTWVGDTENDDFENLVCFGCGTDIELWVKNTVFIDFSGYTVLNAESSSPLSVSLGIKRNILGRTFIHGYGMVGLSEESADFSFGSSLSILF